MAKHVIGQKNKGETTKTPWILQPLTIPCQWVEEVSMDFTIILPKSEGNIAIMVV